VKAVSETEEQHKKRIRKRAARALQKETGIKYTTALRFVTTEEEAGNE
jgi:hypothetical protein